VIGTDFTGSCKFNYHTITTATISNIITITNHQTSLSWLDCNQTVWILLLFLLVPDTHHYLSSFSSSSVCLYQDLRTVLSYWFLTKKKENNLIKQKEQIMFFFKWGLSTIPSISTIQTIASHLKPLNTIKPTTYTVMGI
jgi:hypothetical protein